MIAIVCIWISALIFNTSAQLNHLCGGVAMTIATKPSLYTVSGSQHLMQLDFGIMPTPKKRSRREVIAAWIQSVTAE